MRLIKYTLLPLFIFGLSTLLMQSCDKVVIPEVITTDIDTNVVPGNFIDYDFPTFESNTNTYKNVLIEDFTGHQCGSCPAAAIIAEDIVAANPGRAYTVAIHAGYEGVSSLQEVLLPNYPIDFTTPEGIEIAKAFTSLGLVGNPKGTVNRILGSSGSMILGPGDWSSLTSEVLTTELDVNLQAKSTYFPETNGVILHTESEFLNVLEGTYNIVVYVVENERIAPQKIGVEPVPEYKHHNIHLGNLFGEAWGRTIASETTNAGTKIQTDFSYFLPDGLNHTDMHFLIYVFNRETYEVMQVIKHEF